MKKIFYTLIISLTIISSCTSSHPDLNNGLYAEIKTNKGDMLLNLTFKETPVTVANFVSLSEGKNKNVSPEFLNKKFYDGLIFHRVISNFMIQGGDPLGTGSGGPGYSFKDEFDENLRHDSEGVLSMANSGPKTNGSQFFITHTRTPWLDDKHSVFGKLIKGNDVLNSIRQNDTIKEVVIIRKGREARSFNAPKIFANHFEEDRIAEQERLNKLEQISIDRKNNHDIQRKNSSITDTGLQYTITEKSNSSISPKSSQTVMTQYSVFFENGNLLDTNLLKIAELYDAVNVNKKVTNGYRPLEAKIGPEDPIIPGLKEGLKLLELGDKATIFIPYHLAYGETGRGRMVPPKTNLIFEVEIVEIK